MSTPVRPASESSTVQPYFRHGPPDPSKVRMHAPADLDEPLPPPMRRGRGWAFLLWGAGLVVAIILVVVVLNIDRSAEEQRERRAEEALGIDAAPPALGIDNATAANQMHRDPTMAVGTKRGWIQATENGRLSQEYRYARSEPGAAGRLHLINPEVKIYLKDRRVVTMRGELADVQAPNKALESGTMSGNVIIRLFEQPAGGMLDESRDQPVLEVHTPEASFDNFQGEILCPREVDIQTQTAHLPAYGLRLQVNDLEGRPGQLMIERLRGQLRLSDSMQARLNNNDESTPPDDVAATAPEKARREPSRVDSAPRREPPRSAQATGGTPQERAAQRRRDRMAQRRERQLPNPKPIAEQKGPYFYRLTLNQQVRIQQGDGSKGWTADGDQLHIIFSLDSEELSGSLSSENGSPRRQLQTYGPTEPMSLEAMLAAIAVAGVQEDSPQDSSLAISTSSTGLFKPAESDTIITCNGPISMTPLLNAAEQPESADDSRFELIGSPVKLHNSEDRTNIICASMQYASLSEVLELIGSPAHRLVIDSPELHAECDDRFWIDRVNHEGAFEGSGWMVAGEIDEASSAATQPALPVERRGDVRIAWRDGVDLEFEPAANSTAPRDEAASADAHESFGQLRLAMFNGAVAVNSPDFTLDADRMGVGFPSGVQIASTASQPERRVASIEFIHAEGAVKAGSMSDGGSIHCQDLRVNFRDHEGKTVPLNMLATGEVAAVDQESQTVWANQLDVEFTPVKVDQTVGAQVAGVPEANAKRRADVESLTAIGGVQIQMADGARVFADRLVADGEGRMIVLTGEDVMVVSDRNIIHKGTRLELTERGETVTWPGSGEFAYYTAPVLPSIESRRIDRPIVDIAANPRQMLATWSTSMVYDSRFNNGAGSIEIRGAVNAESTPSALEMNSMTGDWLTLNFAKAETTVEPATAPTSRPETQPTTQPGGLFAMEQRGRQLSQLIARGNARLESKTWLNADHADKPRIFWLQGQHIVYDDQTLEALVQGAGDLLVRDERPEPAPASQPLAGAKTAADLPFGARGTTLFQWTDSLRMTRKDRESSLYDIVMLGDIKVRHRAIDQSLSTMTGERLEATVDRTEGATQRDAGFDLGGSMDLKRIHAAGNVYVDTPKRDVDCDDFDFDYVTGIAQLNAREGRVVTVTTAGNPHPVQARSFLWNTIEDSVTARNISGSSGQ